MFHEENRRFARNLGIAADVFDRPRVALELPPGQERRPEAVSAFALAANLLARLFTRVSLVAPDVPVPCHPWDLPTLRALADPLSEISEHPVGWGTAGSPDIVLGIGAPPTVAAPRAAFVSFSGWVAGLDQAVPQGEPGIFAALF